MADVRHTCSQLSRFHDKEVRSWIDDVSYTMFKLAEDDIVLLCGMHKMGFVRTGLIRLSPATAVS